MELYYLDNLVYQNVPILLHSDRHWSVFKARFDSEVPDVMNVLKFADSKPYFQDTSRVGLKSKSFSQLILEEGICMTYH